MTGIGHTGLNRTPFYSSKIVRYGAGLAWGGWHSLVPSSAAPQQVGRTMAVADNGATPSQYLILLRSFCIVYAILSTYIAFHNTQHNTEGLNRRITVFK